MALVEGSEGPDDYSMTAVQRFVMEERRMNKRTEFLEGLTHFLSKYINNRR